MTSALVTGAGGFIGSHLAEFLVRSGWRVRAMVRYTSSGADGMLADADADVRREIEVVRGDLRDPDAVDQAVRGIDVVFNLAALIAIPYSYEAPESYFQTNVLGTLNILRAARRSDVQRIVQTSTSETYGSARFVPMDETHPASAQSPYAASKVASDQLALSFFRSYGTPVVVLRPFNTYGPRQSARAVIPTVMSQALFSDAIRIGSLTPVRDFLYVSDTCAAFAAAGTTVGLEGGEFNCATGRGVSIGDLVSATCGVVGRPVPVLEDVERLRPQGSEVERLIGSYERFACKTGWAPAVTLENGLAAVRDWMMTRRAQFDVLRYAK